MSVAFKQLCVAETRIIVPDQPVNPDMNSVHLVIFWVKITEQISRNACCVPGLEHTRIIESSTWRMERDLWSGSMVRYLRENRLANDEKVLIGDGFGFF